LFSKPYPFLSFGSFLADFEIQAGLDDKAWLKREEAEEVATTTLPENQLPLFE
jgi:hypothetical protein